MTVLPVYVIYADPSDYPGFVVLRRQHVRDDGQILVEPDPLVWVDTSAGVDIAVMQVRTYIPDGLICIPRSPEDEPQIVESWL